MKRHLFLFGLVCSLTAAANDSRADCPVPPALNQCKACHALEPGKPSRATGPNLHGIVGQPAMHAADYTKYSEAIKAAQAKGLTWSEENLYGYLADPKSFLNGFNGELLRNGMMFQLKNEDKRKAAIEGLKTISTCQ